MVVHTQHADPASMAHLAHPLSTVARLAPPREKPGPPSPRRVSTLAPESDPCGDRKLDLGAAARACPHSEATADSLRPLAHAGEPPVALPPRFEHLWIAPPT